MTVIWNLKHTEEGDNDRERWDRLGGSRRNCSEENANLSFTFKLNLYHVYDVAARPRIQFRPIAVPAHPPFLPVSIPQLIAVPPCLIYLISRCERYIKINNPGRNPTPNWMPRNLQIIRVIRTDGVDNTTEIFHRRSSIFNKGGIDLGVHLL